MQHAEALPDSRCMLNNFEVDFLSHAIGCTVEFHGAYGLCQGLIIQLELDTGLFQLFIGDFLVIL